ncbi:hypothetical protein NXS19_002568 [Fusarium pseudograminearum]|uniref:Uncharacterized protein n=1 Tax=Fusarium pseudograminearum (strain CS3096) TaxID=1028729 RepID=K3UQI9_FUSPC|nr:hypothetical protein FPSE_05134 [Fusarium pseudograminearum CS3096]EKJ74666.1 hypothetical protein FPSE_05134 [Fusarium pseudograminearum CS3096]KAF0645343.1 hypothetical protein FPSE5266_05134 [Fusarium pseudograminearum]UZP34752.1 hypothetical protein NXS19_002568 [Fusarium pseudograminearum]
MASSSPNNMAHSTLPFPPSIEETAQSIRQQSARYSHVNQELQSLVDQVENDPTTGMFEFITQYVGLRNLPLAVAAFSIHRFPYDPLPLGSDLDSWVPKYLPTIAGSPKLLSEFLQLADNINQLSAIYASMPQDQQFWEAMYRRSLYQSYGDDFSRTAAWKMPDLPLYDLATLNKDQIGMVFGNQDQPGDSPVDSEGNPINPELLVRVQQSFWFEEIEVRAKALFEMFDYGSLPIDEETLGPIYDLLENNPSVDVVPFQRLVKWQRLVRTVHKHGVSDTRASEKLFKILRTDRFYALGAQGLIACLPSYNESYDVPYIFKLASVNSQIHLFLLCGVKAEARGAWFDGWFEKYPVSDPDEHVSLDTEYPSDEDGQVAMAAYAIGLDDEDMEFLWGMKNPQIPADPPVLDSVDETLLSTMSTYDMVDIRAMWSDDPYMFDQRMHGP